MKSTFQGWMNLLGRRSRRERDMDVELRSHIERYAGDLVRSGVPHAEAERRARVEFGGVESLKDECREARGLPWLDALTRDLRYAARLLLRNPGFTAVAVATLAIGIGANTAIFSLTNAVLFRALPFPDPARLVILEEYQPRAGSFSVAWPNFLDLREQNRSFQSMAALDQERFELSGTEKPELLTGAMVSASFFRLTGAVPVLGRPFSESEDQPGAKRVVMLGYRFWQNQFGADPGVLGKTVILGGNPYQVVGVVGGGHEYFSKATDVYIPVGLGANNPAWLDRSKHFSLRVLARLRPGVSLAAARTDLSTIMKRLELAYPQSNKGIGPSIKTLEEVKLGSIQPAIYALLGAVGLVLLIACANVANLLLTRQASRQRELAIRTAMGAGRRRVLRQLLTESFVLSLLGGAAGLVLAYWGIPALIHLAPDSIPHLADTHVDGTVILFTFCIAVVAGILFGIAPALQASKLDLSGALKESGRGSMSGKGRQRLRSVLFVSEVALALVLVIGSGLLIRSLAEVLRVKPGFNAENVLAVNVTVLSSKYRQADQKRIFFQTALDRLRALPGVSAAGAVMCPPVSNVCWDYFFTLPERPALGPGETPLSVFNVVDPGYFRAMEIPLIAGRYFTDSDDRASASVAIINQTLARQWWPHESPLGKRMHYGRAEDKGDIYEIIGVVGDVKQTGLDEEQLPETFLPAGQSPSPQMVLMIRAASNAAGLAAAAEQEIRSIDRDLPVRVQPISQSIAETLARRKFSTLLLAIFGGAALVLALVGIYGVTAYTVSQRTHEIGIRKALGAQQSDVLLMVVRQGLQLTLAGIAIGLAGGFVVTRLLSKLLFGVLPSDPLTFTVVPILVTVVALLAAYLPARKAARVDPLIALRYE